MQQWKGTSKAGNLLFPPNWNDIDSKVSSDFEFTLLAFHKA